MIAPLRTNTQNHQPDAAVSVPVKYAHRRVTVVAGVFLSSPSNHQPSERFRYLQQLRTLGGWPRSKPRHIYVIFRCTKRILCGGFYCYLTVYAATQIISASQKYYFAC